MEEEIIIKPKYTFREYSLFIFRNRLNTLSLKIIVLIAFLMMVLDFLYWFNFIDESSFKNGIPLFNIIFPSLVFLIIPFIIYRSSKIKFKNNFRLKEDYEIIFNSDFLQERGETFDVKTPWKELKLVSESKTNFLITHSKYVTSFYPKRFFTKQQIIDFKKLIQSVDIKNKLK